MALNEPVCEQLASASGTSSAAPSSPSTGLTSPALTIFTGLTQTDWVGSDESILSAGASLASRSPKLGNSELRRTTATSGRRCAKSLHSADPLGSLVKMLLASSRWHSTMCWLTWKVSATPRGRLLFQLAPSMRVTEGTESGSLLATPTAKANQLAPSMKKWPSCAAMLPTPTATSYGSNQGGAAGRVGKVRYSLSAMAQKGLLPTPTARDWKDGTAQSCQNVEPNGLLGRVVHLLPTPRACSGLRSSGMNRTELTTQQGVPGSLNPAWVEWLMGFPEGWTDLGPSETRSFRKSSTNSAAP